MLRTGSVPVGYRAALALTSLLLLAGSPAAGARVHRHAKVRSAVPASSDVYSRRALRRARTILQLKLLELRAERLDRIRKIVERRLPIDLLFDGQPKQPMP